MNSLMCSECKIVTDKSIFQFCKNDIFGTSLWNGSNTNIQITSAMSLKCLHGPLSIFDVAMKNDEFLMFFSGFPKAHNYKSTELHLSNVRDNDEL